MIRVLSVVSLFLSVSLCCAADDGDVGSLAKHRARYAELVGAIDQERDASLLKARTEYAKELNVLVEGARKAGDLDRMTVLTDELKAVTAVPAKPTKAAPDTMPGFKKLQLEFLSNQYLAVNLHKQKVDELNGKYIRSLAKLEKRLVVAGRLGEAKDVRAEHDKLVKEWQDRLQGKAPAVFTIHKGPKHSLVPFERGEVIKGSTAVIDSVPKELKGWRATKTKGVGGSFFSLRVSKAGYILGAVNENVSRAPGMAGWEITKMSYRMRGSGNYKAVYKIFRKQVTVGMARTPSLPKAYMVLLVPPAE